MAGGHCCGRNYTPVRLYFNKGICRIGMANRYSTRYNLGGIWYKPYYDNGKKTPTTSIRGALVLFGNMGNRGRFAHCEQYGSASKSFEELFGIFWSAGCLGAMVVRA